MIFKKYEVSIKTYTFQNESDQKSFVKKYINFLNSCDYKLVPGTMVPVTPRDISVENTVFVGATVKAIVLIEKPENEDSVLKKIYNIENKLDVELLGVNLIDSL